MELGIKQRQSGFCNLKVVLIFCVVLGHLLEHGMIRNKGFIIIYKSIYLFHMPVFVFLLGYFLHNQKQCIKQCKKMIQLYLVFQGMLLAIRFVLIKVGLEDVLATYRLADIGLRVPYWHLWYLPASAIWSCLGAVWWSGRTRFDWLGDRCMKILLVTIATFIACLAGTDFFAFIGREWSLSRMIVFLPYFLIGLFMEEELNWKAYKSHAVVGLFLAGIIGILYFEELSCQFLWHRSAYGILGNGKGMELRMVCYILGILLGFGMLVLIPERHTSISKVGNYTMELFLIHPFIILFFQDHNKLIENDLLFIILFSCCIIYFIYKIIQWGSTIYCIK